MKNFNKSPIFENIFKTLKEDALGRNDKIKYFLKLLKSIDDDAEKHDDISNSCSIALDSQWGGGKTFFVKQIKLILDYYNMHSEMTEESKSRLKPIIETLELECCHTCSTIYYDAWVNDNVNDPILSLVYTATKSNQSTIPLWNKRSLPKIFGAIAESISGIKISNLQKELSGVDLFESIKDDEYIKCEVNEFINTFMELHGATQLVIFIDELDRCRPTYAIQLLERIKHYFNDKRLVFIFSVNLQQLQHTVRSYYGADFDATGYLNKFFDLRISLPEIDYDNHLPNILKFVHSSRGPLNRIDYFDEFSKVVVKYFRFSLRDIQRFYQLTRIAFSQKVFDLNIVKSDKPDMDAINNAVTFTCIFFIPIVLGLSIKDVNAYTRFITGNDSKPLCEILLACSARDFPHIELLLNEDETFEKVSLEDLKDRLNDIYSVLFPKDINYYNFHKSVGKMSVSNAPKLPSSTKSELNQIISLLAPFSDYEYEQ